MYKYNILVILNMLLLLLLLPTAIALDTNIPCDLPVYDTMPEKWQNKAFILKNTVPAEFRKEVELDTLYEKYGDYEIGIDHPGYDKPPSQHWQKTTMAQYIDNHVMKFHNKSIEEKLKDTEYVDMTLFGPTDIMLKGEGHNMIPDHVQKMFECSTGVRVFGLTVKGTGYHFHKHGQVFNRLVYGKKIWLLTDSTDILDKFSLKPISAVIDTLLQDREQLGIRVCVTEPGDAISVPHGTYHATLALETSFFGVCALENYDHKPWYLYGSGIIYPYWYKMLEDMYTALVKQQTIKVKEPTFDIEAHDSFIHELIYELIYELDYTISSTVKDKLIMTISHCDGYTYWAPYPTDMCPTSHYLIANTKVPPKLKSKNDEMFEMTPDNTKHLIEYF